MPITHVKENRKKLDNSFDKNNYNEENNIIENNENILIKDKWKCNKCETINDDYLPVCKNCYNSK